MVVYRIWQTKDTYNIKFSKKKEQLLVALFIIYLFIQH